MLNSRYINQLSFINARFVGYYNPNATYGTDAITVCVYQGALWRAKQSAANMPQGAPSTSNDGWEVMGDTSGGNFLLTAYPRITIQPDRELKPITTDAGLRFRITFSKPSGFSTPSEFHLIAKNASDDTDYDYSKTDASPYYSLAMKNNGDGIENTTRDDLGIDIWVQGLKVPFFDIKEVSATTNSVTVDFTLEHTVDNGNIPANSIVEIRYPTRLARIL